MISHWLLLFNNSILYFVHSLIPTIITPSIVNEENKKSNTQ